LIIKEISNRSIPRAIPKPNSPFEVSKVIAVVIVRVDPFIFPPNIIAAPTSAIFLPKPAITADITAKRASLIIAQAACISVAPKVRAVCLTLISIPWIAEWVKAIIIGNESRNCPIITAVGVYNRPKYPNGPTREIREYTRRPITTVGIARALFNKTTINFFPQKFFDPITNPSGTPIKEEKRIAIEDTLRENKTIWKTSLSKDNISAKAFCNPSIIKLKIISPDSIFR
jgi:hypothetical protein